MERLAVSDLTPELIQEFLQWLELDRGCSASTRNQRLAAIHAFFRYLQMVSIDHIRQCQQILAIPMKKHHGQSIQYLTLDGIKAILAIPDPTREHGRRDLVMLSLLYDTGARVQEIADLVVADVRLETPATVKLTGKGNKTRIVPLMTPTAKLIQQYISDMRLGDATHRQYPLFTNRSGEKLTRAGITYVLKKYADQARILHPEWIPQMISPHCLRHSKAMHLLQSGVNLVYIRDLLGHVSITTTEVYAKADSEMKRKALEGAYANATPSEMPVWQQNTNLLKWLKALGN